MTFKPRLWEPVAWILTGINVVSVWFAALPGETWHATGHAVLAGLFALWAQHLRRLSKKSVADASMEERLRELEAQAAQFSKGHDVEARLAELEERLDFTERALIEVRARPHLPPKA